MSAGRRWHARLLVLTLLATSACGDATGHRSVATIQVDIEGSPISTDPRFATDILSSRINELIFDSLLRIDRNGQFVGRLAESFERPDATTIVFHLRRGVRFGDGRPLTARDVKYTFDSILAPETMTPKRAGLSQLKAVTAVDDYTIEMKTTDAYAPALEFALQNIVPDGTPLPARSVAIAPPGAGPFRMTSFSRDESIVLERNPYFPAPAAGPRTLFFKVVPDPTVRALELTEGVADFSENNIQPDVLPYLGKQPHLAISKSPGSSYRYLAFNFHDPYLRDVRVRRAIAYSIDRVSIIQSMIRGGARAATGLLAPENWAYEDNLPVYNYDLARANTLLDQAGYPRGPGGMRRLRFVYKTTPEQLNFAQALQAMLKRVGISLDIRSNEFATFYSDIQRGNFDLTSMNWVGINDPHHYYMVFDSKMTPPHGMNRGYYSNPEMDRLVESGDSTLDLAARKNIYAQVQRLAAEDLPYVSLWWDDTIAVMNRELRGFTPYPNGSLISLATLTLQEPGAAEPAE
ncbi:MAG: ABC transporter substrate-binding protein [Candidatus Binatus sp.]|uniref:ABC transporter substrate-binding protein n=1 Tax=Candidatus Binatus sp. TaxID=2811406 RepID=UPI0027240ADE|nr:ABC transporter substrate-binding protein [Candidatus Binatus sp.]MDO8431242.1 ABC transporter substrate-binding protein [Candidatus Binatus sp.]